MSALTGTISGEAALVDPPKGDLSQRGDSAKNKTRCKFKAKAQARIKAKAKAQAAAKVSEKSAPKPELDAWGFPIETARDTSRQRNRKRKLAAAKVLYGQKPTSPDGKVKSRSFTVCICGKFSRNDVGGDLVLEASASGKTNVGNAQFCGSSWTCADCAQHVGITRGSYVEKATAQLRAAGLRVVMTTMTVPHKLWETCGIVFDRLKASHARLDSDGSYRRLMVSLGYIGRIRVIEITYGKSGWHVHSHELMVFCGPECETTAAEDNAWADEMQATVYPIWNRIIFKISGQQASKEHGFTVVPVWSQNDYVAKLPEQAVARADSGKPRWGAEAELTKAHVKKAEKGGRTPWDILDGCYTNSEADIALFRDYAQATWNRTQFEVTKALRELLETLGVAQVGTELEIIRNEPDYVFADELEEMENDGDQSQLTVDRVLIDRDNQSAAHLGSPRWLEQVRHDVELELVMDLPSAMRKYGFRLELIEKLHYVATRTNIDAPQGQDYDPDLAREAAHFEPNVWRAIYRPPACAAIWPEASE